jgi:hypothetical protein
MELFPWNCLQRLGMRAEDHDFDARPPPIPPTRAIGSDRAKRSMRTPLIGHADKEKLQFTITEIENCYRNPDPRESFRLFASHAMAVGPERV